jgi:K+-sensing histidine kinase KdpD
VRRVQLWATSRARASWEAARRHAPTSGRVATGIIVILIVAVTVLRWFFDRASEEVALLYVIPIALSALRFGRRGGIAAAGFGITAFVVLEAVHARGDVDVTGWVAPPLAMALMGGLVGHLSQVATQREADQKRQAQQIEELAEAQRLAMEAGDSVVQRAAAARWMLEAGQSREALAALGDAVADGIARVHGRLDPLARDDPLDDEPLPREPPLDEQPPADDELLDEEQEHGV